MPQYVPYFSIVPQPLDHFRKFYGETPLGTRDLTAAEFAQTAREDINSYRIIVARSPGFGFYTQAPAKPHHVVTPEGESRYLESTAEVKSFYASLNEQEQKLLQHKNPDISKLLGR